MSRWAWLVVVGVVVAFWPVLGPDEGLFYGDHILAYRQHWFWIVDALSHGELPARTLGSAAGLPMESKLNGTYTPMTALFFLGPFDFTYDLFVAGHVLVLAFGVYGLARGLGATSLEAAAAAAVALMGPVLSFENLLVGLQGFTWAPWTWWAFLALLRRPGPGPVAGLGLAGGCHLQGIMPETALVDVIAGAAIMLYALRKGWIVRPGRAFVGLLLGLALAFGVAAIELVPVLEDLSNNRRGAGFDLVEQSRWSLRPIRLLDALAPAITSLNTVPFAEPPAAHGETRTYLVSLYLGLAPVLGVLPLLDPRTRRRALWCWALLVLGVLLALGDFTAVHGWVAQLPVLRSGRYPVKFLVISAAALAVLVALGCSVAARRPRATLIVAAAHFGLTMALWSTLRVPEVRDLVASHVKINAIFGALGPEEKMNLVMADLQGKAQVGLLVSAAALLALIVTLAVKRQDKLPSVAVVFMWGGLALGAHQVLVGSPTRPRVLPEMAAALEDGGGRFYMVSPTHRHPRERPDPEANLLGQYILLHRLRGALVLPEGRRWYDYDAEAQGLPISTEAFAVLAKTRGPPADRLLGRMGIRWLSIWLELDKPGRVTVPIEGQPPQYLYPLEPVRPPISVHPRWARVGAEVEAGAPMWSLLLGEETFDVIVVDGAEAPAPTLTSSAAAAACAAAATVEGPPNTRGDRLEIVVDAPCPVMLLVIERWAPQWTATLDGAEVPVLAGDIAALAVAVPKGRHEVVLRFEARSRRWLPVSVAAWVLGLGLVGVDLWRRRRRAGPEPSSER